MAIFKGYLGSALSCSVLASLGLFAGCAGNAEQTGEADGALSLPSAKAAGALVAATIKSRVGVVLDEIPPAQRSAAANYYLSQKPSFWLDRAKQQIRHTNYRLTYRDFFYDESEHRRMMALPPEELWTIDFGSKKPKRVVTPDGHDAVEIAYTFTSTILTDVDSPGAAEPKLKKVGGVWNEPFDFPLDPEFLFQRTGYACLNEDGYPRGTAESENAYQLFDQTCDVETADARSCHLTALPSESCLDALANHVGRVDTELRLERLPYTKDAATRVRLGKFTQASAPDLAVLQDQLANNWIEYRYVAEDSCAIREQCVGGSGWRRLLLFDASIENSGAVPLSVGSVDPSSPASQHNMFEFSECHQHYHFRHYGDFSYGSSPGDKRAFCVESTDRYFNNEQTPLVHDFGCENQGVAVGWGDTYIAGVECNWIDITDLAISAQGTTQSLKFEVNPDKFLCEGKPRLDAAGQPVYEPTSFVTETGAPVDRPVCDFASGYASNNTGVRAVRVPKTGGLVTAFCTRNQAGPLRDCGFSEQPRAFNCKPGKPVHLKCRVSDGEPNQVLRVCESSKQLGGMACMYTESLSSQTVTEDGVDVSFECPKARSNSEPGGAYALYTAPVLPTDSPAQVTCKAR